MEKIVLFQMGCGSSKDPVENMKNDTVEDADVSNETEDTKVEGKEL